MDLQASDPKIREIFSSAYILAGSPCSGKSTIAERLSTQFQLPYYKLDDHQGEHLSRCRPERQPVMSKFAQMDWNKIWLRPVPQQVQEEFEYYRELFEFILQDLAGCERTRPMLLEGVGFLPELIGPGNPQTQRVVFMVPDLEFQTRHYEQRPWIRDILRACDDPRQAFDNWMMRDHLFGQEVLRQAQAAGYRTLLVDGSRGIDELYEQVKAHFGLA